MAANDACGTVLPHVCCVSHWVVQWSSPWSSYRWFLERARSYVFLSRNRGKVDGRGDHQEDRRRPRLWVHLGRGREGVLLPPQRDRELRRASRWGASLVRDRAQR